MTKTEKGLTLGVIGLGIMAIALAVFLYLNNRSLQAERNQLTKKDAEVQQLDTRLQIAESNLLAQRELNRQALSELSNEVKDLMKKYDLELQSRDETIAKLVNSVKGGSTNVTVENTTNIDREVLESVKIGYSWADKFKRFHLQDPNIWDEGDETFKAQQHLRVRGYVLQGKDGKLQTRHVDVEEIYQKGLDENGKPIFDRVPGSSFELVDADFSYVDPKIQEKTFLDIFALRPYASFDTAISPGLGIEFIQFGRWIDWANVGLGAELSADLSDPLGSSLQNSRVGLSAQYHFIPPFLGTNMALGAGVSVPFRDLSVPVLTIDAMFYLTDPIPLFGE
jgi:hypothetical protein